VESGESIEQSPEIYDVVIVGAGPAGLSANHALRNSSLRVLLLEEGTAAEARDRTKPIELLQGVGGAGLYSDGKHSFFPAATRLWTLDSVRLHAALGDTVAILKQVEAPIDAAIISQPSDEQTLQGSAWVKKNYPSVYLSIEQRLKMIEALQMGGVKVFQGRLVNAKRLPNNTIHVSVAAPVTASVGRNVARSIVTRNLILATGRFSPLFSRQWLPQLGVSFAFQRLEFGVRFETHHEHPLFEMLQKNKCGVDAKLKFQLSPGVALRTFCTCRRGTVALGHTQGVESYSAHADIEHSDLSSIGLCVRITDESLAAHLSKGLYKTRATSFTLDEKTLDLQLAKIFESDAAQLLGEAIRTFIDSFPALRGNGAVKVYAPLIEGVSDYAVHDEALRIAPHVFVAGDMTGSFRGLVASMVSARYVAGVVLDEARSV
jgi:uncharacterized protein